MRLCLGFAARPDQPSVFLNAAGVISSSASPKRSRWWPDAPEGPWRVRFEHSPGRRDIEYLGNQSAFDAAFVIEPPGAWAIIGVETRYHEHAKREPAPREAALARYIEVTERSGAFADDWRARLVGTDPQQIWLDHLLVLSMMQHRAEPRVWGRFVLVYPAGNPDSQNQPFSCGSRVKRRH